MRSKAISCIKRVGGLEEFSYCGSNMIKYGISLAGKQRYKCIGCKRTQIDDYTYNLNPDIGKCKRQLEFIAR